MLVQYAVMWHLTIETKSGAVLALSTLFGFLPQAVVSIFGGVWADRVNRKALVIAADGTIAVTTLALALLMLGGADDYTPAAPCARYVEWFRSKGVDAAGITYDGAYHMFDTTQKVVFVNSLQTGRNCDARYDLDRNFFQRLDTNQPLRGTEQVGAYFRGCVSRGATIGGDYRAGQKAATDVAAFVKQVFKL